MDYGALIDSHSSAHTSQGHTQSPICFSPSRYSRQILTSTFVHCNCCLQDLSIIQSITCKMCALLSQKLLFPSYCDIAWWNKMVKLWGSLLASPSVRVLKLHYVSLLAFFFFPWKKIPSKYFTSGTVVPANWLQKWPAWNDRTSHGNFLNIEWSALELWSTIESATNNIISKVNTSIPRASFQNGK